MGLVMWTFGKAITWLQIDGSGLDNSLQAYDLRMPSAKSPDSPVWYVYQFEVRGVPFYVGVGRGGRASYRIPFVCSLIRRELAGKPVTNWVLSNRVIKALILTPEPVTHRYLYEGLDRKKASQAEVQTIKRLLAKGHVLANVHYNGNTPPSEQDVLRYLRRKLREKAK